MILGIIQVRMGSTRLPKKALLDIAGKPILQIIVERVKHSKLLDKVVIATTDKDKDKIICEFAEKNNISFYAGKEEDVVDRIYQTAKKFNADTIVRITGDCPLTDPKIIDKLITVHKENETADYISNVHPATYPDGLDLDLVTFPALERLWKATRSDAFNSEWFYNYMKENPNEFRRLNVENDRNLSAYRLTVDYKEDLELIDAIFRKMAGREIFYLKDVMKLLEKDHEIKALHERYQKKMKFIRDIAFKEAKKNENK